ncbi:MAG: DNA polymerase III subunit beta [Deferribacteraceae bacterium]|jgi:DNA polymerase-3 subunit beta|nr:DNA polymerase III subunit beta [Deferribacteraceae bacterium]
MKFSVAKEKLYPFLQHSGNFTTNKNLSTILQNILIEAEGTHVTIKATNFQTGFTASIEAQVVTPGVTTVSAKKLSDIVRELPDGKEIDFVFDGSRLHVKSGKSSFQLSTMDAELFPKQPTITPEYSLTIDGAMLMDLFKRIAFCISTDTSKVEYNGAHMNIFGDRIEISAADYQRIASSSEKLAEPFTDEFIINIPKKTVLEVVKILDGAKNIHLETDKKQVAFKTDSISITSKLIEKYIKSLTRLFNEEYRNTALIDKGNLFEVVKRISVITSDVTHGVYLSFAGSQLTITSMETEYGKGQEVIDDVEYSGEPMDIIFNAKHLMEILSNITSERVKFAMNSKLQPALILPDNQASKYLLVPIAMEKIS